MTTKVTSKGQVTIPKAVREMLDIKPGSSVDFVLDREGEVVLRRSDNGGRPRDRWERLLGHAGPGPTTDEIMAMTRGDD